MEIPSYGKVYNLGHRALARLFDDPVTVEEKIDGSQFSFARIDGQLRFRSRSVEVFDPPSQNMFLEAVLAVKRRAPLLYEGVIYRGEFLARPRHNVIAYDRVPRDHIMLWEIQDRSCGTVWSREAKEREAQRLGFECVPLVYEGMVRSVEDVAAFMDGVSVLGGSKPEGMVFKNPHRFDADGHLLKGKYVSDRFREIQGNAFRANNPTHSDVRDQIAAIYGCEARWEKAIQHLRERGELASEPKDIGPLMREVCEDIAAECTDEIKDRLWQWARKEILRRATAGIPEWYKSRLLEAQFSEGATCAE